MSGIFPSALRPYVVCVGPSRLNIETRRASSRRDAPRYVPKDARLSDTEAPFTSETKPPSLRSFRKRSRLAQFGHELREPSELRGDVSSFHRFMISTATVSSEASGSSAQITLARSVACRAQGLFSLLRVLPLFFPPFFPPRTSRDACASPTSSRLRRAIISIP